MNASSGLEVSPRVRPPVNAKNCKKNRCFSLFVKLTKLENTMYDLRVLDKTTLRALCEVN